MAHGSADQVAARWAQGMQGSTERIKQGVMAVQVAPGQLAARQKGAYVQNVQAAADKWARNVGQVSLADWQRHTIDKGVARIAQGATTAEPKFQAFMQRFLPYVDQQRSALPARGNLEANIARMTAWTRAMHAFGGKKS